MKQRGSAGIAALIILGIIALAGIWFAMTYMSYNDRGNQFENTVGTKYRAAQTVFSKYTLKMQDSIGLLKFDRNSLKDVMKTAITAQFGDEGSKAMMQWFQGQNIPINNDLVNKIQVIIDGGRDEYALVQKELNFACQAYKLELGMTWEGWWYKFVGRPSKSDDFNLEMCNLVLDADTNEAYETKEAKPISFQ